jgi:hypothetical protein
MTNRRIWTRAATGLIAMLLAFTTSVRAQSPDVPEQWIAYAQLVSHQFQTWLEADDDNANELHRYLNDHIPEAAEDNPPYGIGVKAWIGADGRVAKVEFKSLGDANADALLRHLLTGHLIIDPPPSDMRQPLRIRLQLTANRETAQ